MSSELDPIAAELGLELTLAQSQALSTYLDLLERWNATYNLTAVRDRAAMRTQHLADCLAVVPALRRQITAGRLLDVGSGGGLPGVVLALLTPELQVTCVDAVGKKAAFVRQVASSLGLPNLKAEHARVEALRQSPFDVVVSRAFASLTDFVGLTRSHLKPGSVWMAMKGKHPAEEIGQLPVDVEVFHVEQLKVPGLAAERCLIWLRPRAAMPEN